MSNIKLAVSNIAWDNEHDEKVYEFLRKNKITGLEIAPTRIFKEKPYEQLEKAKEYSDRIKERYDLNIISMQSIWFGKNINMFESENSTKELIDYTKQAIDFAETINCTNLVFGCPRNRNMNNYEIDYPKALSFFNDIGKYALDRNVIIAIEPNPTIYNTNFLNNTSQALQFVKEINLNSIKVNYDLGTVIYNNEKVELLEDNIEYINHIHISEPNLELIEKREIHKQIINIIKNKHYQNYISIEMKKCNDLDKIKNVIKYVNSIL